jgi:hypothetical protein
MHMVIRAIVYAKDKDGALDKARDIFEMLTANQHPFDYYRMFDNEGTSVSGKGRWGDLPEACLASSKEGKELIDEGFKYTKNKFMEAIEHIRKSIEAKSDEELFEDKYVEGEDASTNGMFKYWCYSAGEYEGSGIFLYNDDGEGIRSQHQLDDALNKYKAIYEDRGQENPNKDDKIWVVPADVHY